MNVEVGNVILLVLLVVLALTVGGCVCVVWAQRGGPPWVRAVAGVTLAAGKLVRLRPVRAGRSGQDGTTTDGG